MVFVTGLGKRFNEMDARSMAALHMEDGIGMDAIDPVRRLRMPTLKKKVIQRRMKEEMLGEELRVLYVAMTRAKEKLILTGAVKDREKRMLSWYREAGNPATTITYATRFSAGSCLDLIMPALLRNQCCEELLKEADLWPPLWPCTLPGGYQNPGILGRALFSGQSVGEKGADPSGSDETVGSTAGAGSS